LALLVGRPARPVSVAHGAKSHNLGAGEGARLLEELEERPRGHLVRDRVGRLPLRRGRGAPAEAGEGGAPKDWEEGPGGRFRDTAASNLWTDLTVPFWSMRENTRHPAQKPEKLLAKLVLASSRPGDLVLDPFSGSGTSAVVAKKLGRRYVAMEIDAEHCLAALRRLELASADARIQGYDGGLFWERNSGPRRA
jgi:site-specific DNA-methyltransferase (adenine-specific)